MKETEVPAESEEQRWLGPGVGGESVRRTELPPPGASGGGGGGWGRGLEGGGTSRLCRASHPALLLDRVQLILSKVVHSCNYARDGASKNQPVVLSSG